MHQEYISTCWAVIETQRLTQLAKSKVVQEGLTVNSTYPYMWQRSRGLLMKVYVVPSVMYFVRGAWRQSYSG